jgi:membrane-bound lytic murein transglycosylase D
VKNKFIILLFSGILLAGSVGAQIKNTIVSVNYNGDVCSDDPIIAMLDSLCTLEFFKSSSFTTDTGLLNVYNFPSDSVPVYDDFIYEYRLGKLDALSPFDLDYNASVKSYIHAYTVQKRNKVGQLLGLAQHYFPLFEETLDKYDLPLELKHLAIIESALNPVAKSKSGAMGLWQFVYGTGKMFNLKINSYVDERCDPYLSTVAACEYLQYLYKMFGDWQLVLAAYNGGPGTLNKAMRRSGKKTYWELRPYLPLETQGYVPAFIAATYVMNYASEHNIYPQSPRIFHYQVDTLHVKNKLTFASISKVLDITVEDLEYLNPSYRKQFIPATEEFNTLVLPKQKVGLFMANETDLYSMNQEVSAPAIAAVEKISTPGEQKKHTIRSGETLSSIASKYRCSVNDLKDWNKLRGNTIHPGDKLIVYTAAATKPKTQAVAEEKTKTVTAEKAKETSDENKFHTIQKGDTLWKIANENGITISELKRLNNISNDNHPLKIGAKIKVG